MGSRQTDFTRQPIPRSWSDAAAEAPGQGSGTGRPSSSHPVRYMPLPSIDMFTAGFATAAMCMMSGYAWYLIYGNGITSPWLVVALGVLIAMTLRLTAGEGERATRAVLAFVFYTITVGVVFLLIASRNYQELYGIAPSFAQLEQELIHGVLVSGTNWIAIATGGLATIATSKLL